MRKKLTSSVEKSKINSVETMFCQLVALFITIAWFYIVDVCSKSKCRFAIGTDWRKQRFLQSFFLQQFLKNFSFQCLRFPVSRQDFLALSIPGFFSSPYSDGSRMFWVVIFQQINTNWPIHLQFSNLKWVTINITSDQNCRQYSICICIASASVLV